MRLPLYSLMTNYFNLGISVNAEELSRFYTIDLHGQERHLTPRNRFMHVGELEVHTVVGQAVRLSGGFFHSGVSIIIPVALWLLAQDYPRVCTNQLDQHVEAAAAFLFQRNLLGWMALISASAFQRLSQTRLSPFPFTVGKLPKPFRSHLFPVDFSYVIRFMPGLLHLVHFPPLPQYI